MLSQRNPKWANHILGQNTGHSKTIGNWGCLLVTYNMLAHYYGLTSELPDAYNDSMVKAGGFSAQYLVNGAFQKRHSSRIDYEGWLARDNPKMLMKLDAYMSEHRPVPVRVDFHPETEVWEQHWVLILERLADGDYLIADPWTGTMRLLSKAYGIPGTDVLEAAFYRLKEI